MLRPSKWILSLNQNPEDGPSLLGIGTESLIERKTEKLVLLATQTILIADTLKLTYGHLSLQVIIFIELFYQKTGGSSSKFGEVLLLLGG